MGGRVAPDNSPKFTQKSLLPPDFPKLLSGRRLTAAQRLVSAVADEGGPKMNHKVAARGRGEQLRAALNEI